jgi:hypothetical protein
VTIDGRDFGTSPVTVKDLQPGDHLVVLENEFGSIQESVTIEAGVTASLVVPLKSAAGAPSPGWISVVAPADVQVYANQQLIGTNRSARIMLPPGRHQLEFVNEALAFKATRSVSVAPAQVSTVKLDWPRGTLSVNALPWAEVSIDGERVGETPIGNVSLPIGTHDVVFRHPELGEQRHKVHVTLAAPARLSVDLRKR